MNGCKLTKGAVPASFRIVTLYTFLRNAQIVKSYVSRNTAVKKEGAAFWSVHLGIVENNDNF